MFSKVALVFNRRSGQQLLSDSQNRVEKLRQSLIDFYGPTGVEYWRIEKFTELEEVARQIADHRTEWVVIAAGDGTIRCLIEKLVTKGWRPCFGIFPVGTVNLVAKELQIPSDPVQWLEQVQTGSVNAVHFGWANGQLFLTVAGAGFDSFVVSRITEKEKKALGKLAYLWQGVETLRKEMLCRNWQHIFRVRLDGGEWREVSSVLVCKSRYYAGKYSLFGDARLSDDYFHVLLFYGRTWVDMAHYIVAIGRETIAQDKTVEIAKAKKIEIECNTKDFPVELDGDVVTDVPLTIEMAAEPLKFLGGKG